MKKITASRADAKETYIIGQRSRAHLGHFKHATQKHTTAIPTYDFCQRIRHLHTVVRDRSREEGGTARCQYRQILLVYFQMEEFLRVMMCNGESAALAKRA